MTRIKREHSLVNDSVSSGNHSICSKKNRAHNGLVAGSGPPGPPTLASADVPLPQAGRFHDLAVEMPGRMRENGHHNRETGKKQQETDGQGPGDD
jgi:hypothetical protein